MGDRPWLTLIGIGEDGLDGLTDASRKALNSADVIMAPDRHLGLIDQIGIPKIPWPVPFSDGIAKLLELKGRKVVVLASGDPFWFGAGSVLAQHLDHAEWQAFPGLSCFAMMANRLGWPLEKTTCLGLHAKPLSSLRPYLHHRRRLIVTLRDGDAVAGLARYLQESGFGQSQIHIGQSLGGGNERVETQTADTYEGPFVHPLCAAIDLCGDSGDRDLPLASGLPDDLFTHDGQLTKRPIRALALSALAPRYGEVLWDIGGGSGSIAIEWLLSDPSLQAMCFEQNETRADTIKENAHKLGVDRLKVFTGCAPAVLEGVEFPDVVFIGGGLNQELLTYLRTSLPAGTRLVAHAVTLESEAILASCQSDMGGTLMRIDLAHSQPIGRKRGWKSSYPVVQWSAML